MYIRIDLKNGEPTTNPNLYRVMYDAELDRFDRLRLPMVYWFEESQIELTQKWQEYLVFINPGMTKDKVSYLLGNTLAFCNKTGFNGAVPRRNYILGDNLQKDSNGNFIYENPRFSKVFTCGGNFVEVIDGVISLMDGNKNPDFTITPRTHPHMFFAVKTTGSDGYPHPFPNGALYDWYMDGKTPVSFLPHVRDGGSFFYNPQVYQDNTARLAKI